MGDEERKGKGRERRREDIMSYPVCSTQRTYSKLSLYVRTLCMDRLLLCVGFCKNSFTKCTSLFLYALELEADFLK